MTLEKGYQIRVPNRILRYLESTYTSTHHGNLLTAPSHVIYKRLQSEWEVSTKDLDGVVYSVGIIQAYSKYGHTNLLSIHLPEIKRLIPRLRYQPDSG
ncbi:hypothetical protein Ppro_3562 [Pelobacter propionicus DSM 2379]|uniref:Uncharacterized protein n=1 Tax=Pelobacter propionicus (strain DSM 2379 / NBRC 103807 / OttBd1) TaxID=338966 RepID=A1AUY3_PELPD|nr:hypothetical protein Ppro_3562 [Pelobacter propionicus DSM 2379]